MKRAIIAGSIVIGFAQVAVADFSFQLSVPLGRSIDCTISTYENRIEGTLLVSNSVQSQRDGFRTTFPFAGKVIRSGPWISNGRINFWYHVKAASGNYKAAIAMWNSNGYGVTKSVYCPGGQTTFLGTLFLS